jgi:biotin transporter BioY
MFVGSLVIYSFGLFWLVQFVGESSALQMGLFPFLVGDFAKILIGVIVLGGSMKISSMISSRG